MENMKLPKRRKGRLITDRSVVAGAFIGGEEFGPYRILDVRMENPHYVITVETTNAGLVDYLREMGLNAGEVWYEEDEEEEK